MQVLARYRSFDRPVQLLLLNQLTINLGFYMLIPYLADHLSEGLGLSVLMVGLILGVRNFSQQGMFLVGGSMADRFGYKPMIVAGCALRTGGFALIGLVDNVPALIAASAATGFAGALFNPAVRAYIAHDAGERRVEAFALFSVFYQAGILIGPIVGLLLTGIDFAVTCLVAATVFAVLTVLQVRALPARRGDDDGSDQRRPVLAQWRDVASTRGFLAFSVAMIGTYVLSYQIYLALPLQARTLAGDRDLGTALVTALYVVSGAVTIAAQMKVTAWCRERWGPAASLSRGLGVLGVAFVPLLGVDAFLTAYPGIGSTPATLLGVAALLSTAALLAIGTAVVLPFEMDTIVGLARNRLVATHYGFYNTVCGVGILAGNAGTGWAIDLARSAGAPYAPWLVLLVVGLLCGAALTALHRRGLLTAPEDDGRAVDDPTSREDLPTVRIWAVAHHFPDHLDDRPTRPLPIAGSPAQKGAPAPENPTRPPVERRRAPAHRRAEGGRRRAPATARAPTPSRSVPPDLTRGRGPWRGG